ncbi:ATP-binding protein [Pseudanabaena sp. FACHB-2040]|uniref:sensor histidine kinase n=1 Tax=Pseudanabaena sp. FACHB-2040 TaxID=2692859 RepID=UPI001F54946E|nr:ATP-binding protein [Pseudanabaena sp. FACHB-2040]
MKTIPLPANEVDRVKALHRYKVLDSSAEQAFDDLTTLAAHICGTPIALVSLIDADRQFFKSKLGVNATETPRKIAFCTHAILQPDNLLIVPDALEDERFAHNPLVTSDPYIRFYAGAPLVTPDGYAIGTLCVIDRVPRQLSPEQQQALRVLSRQVITQLELRLNLMKVKQTTSQLERVVKALKRSNQFLSKTVHQLKHTQAQLVQTEKMSGLGQLVAGIAHEVNNPVNFIYGNLPYIQRYAQDLLELLSLYREHCPNPPALLQRKADTIDVDFVSSDLLKIVSSMKVGTERVRNLVLSLQNFSRKDRCRKEQAAIHQGIDDTLLILNHRLQAKGKQSAIKIVKEYGDLPPIECNAGSLNQVFMNILGNAVDALESVRLNTSSTESLLAPTITIRTEAVQPTNGRDPASIVIRIADNGDGIPQETLRQIFDPFFTTKPVGKGTGLGLSISYQIVVQEHGGMLKCWSQPGRGTEFSIELPLAEQKPIEAHNVLKFQALQTSQINQYSQKRLTTEPVKLRDREVQSVGLAK